MSTSPGWTARNPSRALRRSRRHCRPRCVGRPAALPLPQEPRGVADDEMTVFNMGVATARWSADLRRCGGEAPKAGKTVFRMGEITHGSGMVRYR